MTAIVANTEAHRARPKRFYRHLYVQVLIAIVLGVAIGHAWPTLGESLKPLGDGFIKLVKMIIAPVIFLTVSTGIAGIKEMASVGRIAGKAFAYFLFFSTFALILGLVVANIVRPGAGMNVDPKTLDTSVVAGFSEKAHDASLTGFLMDIIPTTTLSALTDGSVLQVLLVAILFGVALSMVGKPALPVLDLLERIGVIVFRMVALLMRAAPIGAFGAIAFTVGRYGMESLANLGLLIATFYLTSAFFILVILGAVARLSGFSILKLCRYIKAELLLVLGTSSSEAAVPSLMDKLQRAGCAKPVVGLVIPTGYSFNLDGTNIYMTLAALFIAQACNVDLSLGDQIVLLLVAMISSKGAAGVSGAGFVTLAATLSIVPSVPLAGMGLILGIDRFMSECRGLTNFIGNAVATVVIARWDGALDKERFDRALAGQSVEDQKLPSTDGDPVGFVSGDQGLNDQGH